MLFQKIRKLDGIEEGKTLSLTVFKMEFYHFDNTAITMMKNNKSLYGVEVEDDNGRYEFSEDLSYEDAKKIVDNEIQIFAEKLKVK